MIHFPGGLASALSIMAKSNRLATSSRLPIGAKVSLNRGSGQPVPCANNTRCVTPEVHFGLQFEDDTNLPEREREELHRFIKDMRRKGKFLDNNDLPLMKAAPKSGYITDEKAWANLCKEWKFDKDLPEIDFAKQIVLVDVAPGSPNSFQAISVTLNGMTGDLSASSAIPVLFRGRYFRVLGHQLSCGHPDRGAPAERH